VKVMAERDWNTRSVFLFNDILLYARLPSKITKKRVYAGHVPLENAKVVHDGNVLCICHFHFRSHLL
jgi:hypothetical protein